MNITIIGSGWLALPLAQSLSEQGHKLCVTCTSEDKHDQLLTQGFNTIVYRIGEEIPKEMLPADVIIMANTCKDITAYQTMVKHWPKLFKPQIIFTSTTGVYREDGQDHDEQSSSMNAEHPTYLIEQVLKPLNANIIRLSGLVGPKRHPGKFFRKSLSVRNPKNHVNLVHLDDAIGLISAVVKQQLIRQVFNACANNHPTKGKFYSHMAKQLDDTILETTQETSSPGKTINNTKSKTLYTYKHPDVWQMTF